MDGRRQRTPMQSVESRSVRIFLSVSAIRLVAVGKSLLRLPRMAAAAERRRRDARTHLPRQLVPQRYRRGQSARQSFPASYAVVDGQDGYLLGRTIIVIYNRVHVYSAGRPFSCLRRLLLSP